MSVGYVKLIVSDNVTLFDFFKLISCILPGVSAIILPICFLISSIITLQVFQNSKEMIIFMTSGKSALSIFMPLISLGALIASFMLYLQTTGSPYAYKAFEKLKEQIKTQISINLLKPMTFNVIGESVIYVGDISGNELKDIFISYVPKKKTSSSSNIITAKAGKYVSDNNETIFIQLFNGCRQEFDSENKPIATLKFDSLSYDVSPFFKRFYAKSKSTSGKTQTELSKEIQKTSNEELRQNYIAEYHSRIISSFLPIIYALVVSIFLIVPMERGKGRLESTLIFLMGTICQALIMTLVNISTKNSNMIKYNYMIICFVIVYLFMIFIRRRN